MMIVFIKVEKKSLVVEVGLTFSDIQCKKILEECRHFLGFCFIFCTVKDK